MNSSSYRIGSTLAQRKGNNRHRTQVYLVAQRRHWTTHVCLVSVKDAELLVQTAELSLLSVGKTQPHPNAACILTDKDGSIVGKGSLWAQGAECPEVLAVEEAQGAARGGTAYINLETGDCHGEDRGIQALIDSGIRRCVIGLRYPLECSRGVAEKALRQHGVQVEVLQDLDSITSLDQEMKDRLEIVYRVNEHLIHRAALGRPMGILKYAMTLDGKIAATTGHSAWVSGKSSRNIVYETRSRCDAVIIGGQTVRHDNPQLTTRQKEGHQPMRIVMSRTLDLPISAQIWDTNVAPTIVATQKTSQNKVKDALVDKGVEVVEFDFLCPEALSTYCYHRGFLATLWECGGTLAAPAIADGSIHKVMSFIAPKIIGGKHAPSPVGDLGLVEMTQAVNIQNPEWTSVGHDLLLTGYLPHSGGPRNLAKSLGLIKSTMSTGVQVHQPVKSSLSRGTQKWLSTTTKMPQHSIGDQEEFYKVWDYLGCLSNFSHYPIDMPDVPMNDILLEKEKRNLFRKDINGIPTRQWSSVEQYYQAQKFYGVKDTEAASIIERIRQAKSPEEAAKIGRTAERLSPHTVRSDWDVQKRFVMNAALIRKFTLHKRAKETLMNTSFAAKSFVESSPHDFFWGRGIDGSGDNALGLLLMHIRNEFIEQAVQ